MKFKAGNLLVLKESPSSNNWIALVVAAKRNSGFTKVGTYEICFLDPEYFGIYELEDSHQLESYWTKMCP